MTVENARNVILTVGNSMMGDDGAGPLLADLLGATPCAGWAVIDGGSVPENVVHQVRALQPQRVYVVDAAEMGLAPGEVRWVDERCIAEMFIMTTHNLPLDFLIGRLRETIPEVLFLGIQPDVVAYSFPMTPAMHQSVTALHDELCSGQGWSHHPWLRPELESAQ